MKKLFATLLCACAAALLAADAPEMVKLQKKLPPPRLIGTQVAVNFPNLDRGKGPRDVMVPKGAKNLALNKPVSSSDPAPTIGMPEMAVDGEIDGEDGYYVELDTGKQWLQIDLEKPSKIYAVMVWHYFTQARCYKDIVIQISDDPEFEKGVITVYNNDNDNSSGMGAGKDKPYIDTNEGRIMPVDGVKGRYVRLYSKGNTVNENNHYIEVEVYGTQE